MRSFKCLLFAALLLLVGLSPCLADQVVYFLNGKAIIAKTIEKGDKFTVLEMEGGGRMGVPNEQIARIEEYVVALPPAPVVAAPQMVAAPAVTPPVQAPAAPAQQAAVPAAGPVQPSQPGPGMGGHPISGSGRSLADLTPLAVGADGSAPTPARGVLPQPRRGMSAGNQMQGAPGARQNFAAGRRFNGRGGAMPRIGRGGGRPTLEPEPANQAAPSSTQPAARQPEPPPAPAGQVPAPAVQAEEPPPPDNSENEEPSEEQPPPAPEGENGEAGSPPGSGK